MLPAEEVTHWLQLLVLAVFLDVSHFVKTATSQSIPLAPYHVKINCRVGRSFTSRSITPVLCPSASTSCGYFEFPEPDPITGTSATGIYECVDSSILMNERDEEDGPLSLTDFAQMCDHRTRCHSVALKSLNRDFLRYMIGNYGLNLESFTAENIRFCCSLSHGKLRRLIKSQVDELPLPSSEPISCHGRQCHAGAVGCLVHDVFYADDDYNDIKAVKLEWDGDEFRRTDPLDRKLHAMLASVEVQDDGYHCVLPHLNDELYRYCLMIHSHNSGDHCWNSNDHRICCCFVGPGQSTCEPLSDEDDDSSSQVVTIVEGPFDVVPTSTTTTTDEPSTTLPTTTSSSSTTTTSTTAAPTTTATVSTTTSTQALSVTTRTRCRVAYVHESRFQQKKGQRSKPRKEIVCDDGTIKSAASRALSVKHLTSFVIIVSIIARRSV